MLAIAKPYIRPPSANQLIGHAVKRCGKCALLWVADDVLPDLDGIELCPNDRDDESTATAHAARMETMAANVERLLPQPNVSQMAIVKRIPGTVTDIEDVSGNSLLPDPLLLYRSVPNTVVLRGVKFRASDIIGYPAGVTDAVAPAMTTATWTLTIVAALSMAAGLYPLAYNDATFRGVLLVR
jgi:hypothetical protein